jgi:pimeloyl-ACP methyl ester carboxylesterase
MLGSADSWWAIGPALAARGYRVLAVDLPGHGASYRDHQATLDTVVDALLDTVPPRPTLAVGHSLGGTVLAAAVPRLRPGLAVYVDAPFGGSRRGRSRDDLLAEYAAARAGRTAAALAARRPHWAPEDVAAEAAAALAFDPATAASLSATGATRDVTPPPTEPALLILADPTETAVPAETLAWASRHAIAQVTIPGAGHTVWYGHVPRFLAALPR